MGPLKCILYTQIWSITVINGMWNLFKINLIIVYKACFWMVYLGDNCIQIFHFRRYIVGYIGGNFVGDIISNHMYDDLPPQMKNLNIVIPILMYFLTINFENELLFTKSGRHEQHITTFTNHRR